MSNVFPTKYCSNKQKHFLQKSKEKKLPHKSKSCHDDLYLIQATTDHNNIDNVDNNNVDNNNVGNAAETEGRIPSVPS